MVEALNLINPRLARSSGLVYPAATTRSASWRSGDAADCKSVYTGSIPVLASIYFRNNVLRWSGQNQLCCLCIRKSALTAKPPPPPKNTGTLEQVAFFCPRVARNHHAWCSSQLSGNGAAGEN